MEKGGTKGAVLVQHEGKKRSMADQVTLQVKDAQGTPDMVMVLTDDREVLLRGAEILEREVEQAERASAMAVPGNNLISRLIRYLVTHHMEETERTIERLAGGVPVREIEEIGLDSSGLKIRLKGHEHALIHLDANAIDWLEACTFAQQVAELRDQEVPSSQ